MKKLIPSVVCFAVLSSSAFASVTINYGFGDFYQTSNTTTHMPSGGRVNILALDSGSWGNSTTIASLFTNLTDSFVPAGATLVAETFTNNSDGPGTIGNSLIYNYSGNFTAGDELLMVVYPTLTSGNLTPGFNTNGFFFRTDLVIDGSDIAWVAPTDGSTYSLGAYTLDLGGTLPNDQFTAGASATGGAGFTTIPEPSTFALLALGSGAFLIMRKRRKLS